MLGVYLQWVTKVTMQRAGCGWGAATSGSIKVRSLAALDYCHNFNTRIDFPLSAVYYSRPMAGITSIAVDWSVCCMYILEISQGQARVGPTETANITFVVHILPAITIAGCCMGRPNMTSATWSCLKTWPIKSGKVCHKVDLHSSRSSFSVFLTAAWFFASFFFWTCLKWIF